MKQELIISSDDQVAGASSSLNMSTDWLAERGVSWGTFKIEDRLSNGCSDVSYSLFFV
jgi:hypothetical protein